MSKFPKVPLGNEKRIERLEKRIAELERVVERILGRSVEPVPGAATWTGALQK